MNQPLIIRGRYVDHTFIPDGPLPDAEGSAQLVITPSAPKNSGSIADAFGSAAVLRSGEDILKQLQTDREEWGDR